MATSEQVHGPDYVDFDEYIDIQLRKTSSTIKATDVLTAAVGILTLITLYLLLFVICDHWIVPGGFGPLSRAIMLAVVGSAACGWLVLKIVVPWRRRVSGLYAASTIEKASPALQSSLLNLVDISQSGQQVNPDIYHSIERRAALALSHVDVNETVDRHTLLRLSNALLAVVVLFCLYWIFSPKNPASSLWRAIVPTANMGVATRTEIFNVRPGDKDVLARSQLEVTADIRGEIPDQTNLFFTTADGKFVDEKVEMRLENEATRKFRCVLTGDNGGGMLQNLTYRIKAGDARTRDYHIRVIQPPNATIESIRLESPAYTRREPATQTTGAIDALEGTHVTLKARTNMPVHSPASLQFFDDEAATKRMNEIPIRVTDGTKLEVDWNLEIRDGVYPHFYRIFCTNLDGESDPNPNLYSLTIHPDQSPEILLRDPKTDLELPANAKLPLAIEARDPDFALSYIDLYIEKDGSPVNGPNIYSGHDQQFKTTYKWSLRDYHFRPKETITYWLEAKDNRQPVANVSRTPKLHIRIIDPVPEKQVQKDLQMAENRQKEETDKSEAANSAQDQQDNDNNPQNGNQKRQQAGQPKPQKQGASRDEDQKSSQQGEGDQRPEEQNGDSQNGNQQDRQNAADGQGKDKDQKSGRDGDKKEKLNPDDPSQDSKVLQEMLDHQRREQQNQKDSKGAGNGNDGADQPKKSDKKSSASDHNQTGDEGSSSKDSQNKKTGEKKSDQGNSSPSNSSSSNSSGTEQSEKKAAGSKSENGHNDETKREGSHQSPDQKNPDQKNPGQKNPEQKNQKDQAAGSGDNKEQASGSKPGEKPSESNPGEKKQEAGRDAKSAQQKGPEKADSNGPKQGASEGQPQSKDEQQKAGDRQQDPNQGPHQPGSSSQDQNQGSKPGQQEPGTNKPSSSNDSSAPGSPSKPTADAKENKSGNASENSKQKPGTADQPNKSPGSSQNGDEPSKDAGKKPDKDGTPQGGSQNNTGDRTNSPNSQNSDDARGKQDANAKKEPGKSENGRQTSGSDDRNQQNSAQQNQQDKGARKANKDQRENGSQKPSTSRDQQDQPDKRTAKDGAPDEKAQKKRDTTDDGSGDNSERQKPQSNHRPKKSADDEPPTNSPQADQGPDKTTRNKKPRPVGGGDSQLGDSADSKENGNKKDATGQRGSKQSTDQQAAGQSQEESGGRKQPGTKKQGGQEREDGSQDQTKKSDNAKPGAQGQQQQESENKKAGSKGQEGQGQPKPGQQSSGQKGQKGQEGQGKPGQQAGGQKGQSGAQSGKDGASKPGDSKGSKGGGSKGSKPGGSSGNTPQGNTGGGMNNGQGGGQGEPLVDTTNQANLNDAKKATDLVLNTLDKQLKRGQIDKKLADELGWNKDQIRRFVERMKEQRKAAEDPTSQASEARRLQFEETLKSLDLHGPVKARSSQAVPKTNDAEFESNRSIPPPEYRDIYNAFTKSLAKQARPPAEEKK